MAPGFPETGMAEGLLHLIYEVALNPEHLPALADLWERCLDAGPALDPADLAGHLARARRFLDQLPPLAPGDDGRLPLDAVSRAAAFLSDGIARIFDCNGAATAAFGISADVPLAALPFDPVDVVTLSETIRRVARRSESAGTLRLRPQGGGTPIVLRISPVDRREGRPMALVVSAAPVWPDGFDVLLQDTLALTQAEVEIVRGLVLGLPVREIAAARGRSVDTVRTQMRSILSKTETHSQSGLVRMVLGLMDLAGTAHPGELSLARRRGQLEDLPAHSLILPDGRRLEWLEWGDPAGTPLVYMHGDFGLVRWPAPAERAARASGLRAIAPIRAGYGGSDPHAPDADLTRAVALDVAALLDHLGVSRTAVLTIGGDLRFAVGLSRIRPRLVSDIIAGAPELPRLPVERWRRLLDRTVRQSMPMLSFIIHAAFVQARRSGKEDFLLIGAGGCAADRAALRDPDLRDAMLHGSAVCLGGSVLAHDAFARARLDASRDWKPDLAACQVPILLIHGAEDPIAPPVLVAEVAASLASARVETIPACGRLLPVAQWDLLIDRIKSASTFNLG